MSRLARFRFRLWDRRVWWSRTWWFQFTHGPLCDRYRHNAFRLGRLHVCRSCTLLYLSLAVTLALIAYLGADGQSLVTACAGLFVPMLVLSHPHLYRHFPRPVKDLLRAGTGVFLGLLAGLLITSWWWVTAAAAVPLAVAYRYFQSRRRVVKSRECDGCPELGAGVCSGYARQADAIRAYRDVIEDELNRGATIPLAVISHNPSLRRSAS